SAERTRDGGTGAGDRARVGRRDRVECVRERARKDRGEGDDGRDERRATEPDAGGHDEHRRGDEGGDERDGPETAGERRGCREKARPPEGGDDHRASEADATEDRARPEAPQVDRAGSDERRYRG